VSPALSFNAPTSGKFEVSGFVDATGSCPAGPDPCTFESGMYLDGVPVRGFVTSSGAQAGSPTFTCGGSSPFFFGGAAITATIPAGQHQLAIGYTQTGGASVTLSFDCEPDIRAIGLYQ
jgi:hypothetical protein